MATNLSSNRRSIYVGLNIALCALAATGWLVSELVPAYAFVAYTVMSAAIGTITIMQLIEYLRGDR